MPTLKEIKGRINSVKSTLKITSAMKLVSSAKLRKAQVAIEAMRPYEQQLFRILATVSAGRKLPLAPVEAGESGESAPSAHRVIVAMASNSSLCGGFNAGLIAKVRSVRQSGDVVYSIGRKMADAMRKDGFPSPEDLSALSEHPAYAPVAGFVERLMTQQAEGQVSEVLLVYCHFISTARQEPVVEKLLAGAEGTGADGVVSGGASSFFFAPSETSQKDSVPSEFTPSVDVIIEPSATELLEALLPKTLKLKAYAALLDNAASEHAARTVAMQAATDNGNDLLEDLTLQYNKGRQQKITNEILDLASGSGQ